MKSFIKIVAFLFVLIVSCKDDSNNRNPDFLAPISIEIPDDLKDDEELVEVIQSSEKSINEFSDNIEKLVIDGKDILNKNEEDYTISEGLKAGKLMLQFVSNSTQMTTTLEEFNTYVENNRTQGIINEKQYKALEEVSISLEERIKEINNKYKDYFK